MLRICSSFVLAIALALGAPAGATVLQGQLRVIDGDTLDIDGVRVRLQGVDAPERGETCRDANDRAWRCGDWAGQQLQAMLQGGRLVCHDLGERTHQRTVARCDLDGRDLAAALIAAGVVRACPRFAAQHPHSQGYMALEAEAIEHRVGLHAGQTPELAGFCAPRPPRTTVTRTSAQGASGGCDIKGNISRSGERIYHVPGQRNYNDTRIDTRRGERWFCSEAEARAAGWRRAQR